MIQERKRKLYFSDKICSICKYPAKIYRLMGEKHFYLCKSKECDYKTRVITEFIPDLLKLKIENVT